MDGARIIKVPATKKMSRCLSCGGDLTWPKRRYCSKNCREKLESKLTLSVGLLNALNVRFATFSFTDSMLFMHVLRNKAEVFSFMCKRKPYRQPAEDLWEMIEGLGTVWHTKLRQTGKRYLATQQVLERAKANKILPGSLKPLEETRPAFYRKSLKYLKLTIADLTSPDAKTILKSAYRRQVKIHHPDHGGDAAFFRAIHDAHTDLINWIKHPRFITHRGIPEKWSYNSERGKKWLPPALILRPR